MSTTTVNISAAQVKDLREKTGAPMMDCKQALTEAKGDLEQAVVILRKKGVSVAAKKATRATSEGAVRVTIHRAIRRLLGAADPTSTIEPSPRNEHDKHR